LSGLDDGIPAVVSVVLVALAIVLGRCPILRILSRVGLGHRPGVRRLHDPDLVISLYAGQLWDGGGIDARSEGPLEDCGDAESLSDAESFRGKPPWLLRLGVKSGRYPGDGKSAAVLFVMLSRPQFPLSLPLSFSFSFSFSFSLPLPLSGVPFLGLLFHPIIELDKSGLEPLVVDAVLEVYQSTFDLELLLLAEVLFLLAHRDGRSIELAHPASHFLLVGARLLDNVGAAPGRLPLCAISGVDRLVDPCDADHEKL